MAYPLILAIILSYIPIYLWLKFFLLWDREKPEPFRWLLILFFLGILSSPLIYFFQFKLSVFQKNTDIFIAGLIEESFKLFIPLILLKKNKYFDEAIDALIYLIVFSLGLAFIENIGVTFEQLFLNHSFSNTFSLLFLRFLGANLLHSLTAGVLGCFFAFFLINHRKKFLIFGLLIASLIHWLFNFLMINFSTLTFLISLILFSIILGLLLKFSFILKNIKKSISYPF